MIEAIEILINSKYALVAVIIATTSCVIQLIRVIWRVVKELKAISLINDNDLKELLIDKAGTISVIKKLENKALKKSPEKN